MMPEGQPGRKTSSRSEDTIGRNPVPEQFTRMEWIEPAPKAHKKNQMDLRFYDVEHGDCCLILSQNNEAVLVDCGYNSTTGWRPSDGLVKQGFGSRRRLHHLILTHPDQDHLADLPGVIEKLKPMNVWQHPQLTLRTIGDLKVTLSKAQEAYLAKKKTAAELQPI